MDEHQSNAPAHPSTEECFTCAGAGVVFIGHMVEDPETGDEAQVIEAVPCRRCEREGS